MARTKRPNRDEAPPTGAVEPLEAFIGAIESGAFAENAEAARMAHCQLCRSNGAARSHERDAACKGARCYMRDLNAWRYEYGWLAGILHSSLFTRAPRLDDLGEFNRHIGDAACVTYGVKVNGATGALIPHPHAPTLRGMVHAALVLFVAWRAGNRQYNLNLITGEELRVLVGRERDELDERDMAERQRRAAAMRDEGLTDTQIADAFGRSGKAVRDWLGPKNTWRARRADWWARHGGNGR
jgi:hypothetical protein